MQTLNNEFIANNWPLHEVKIEGVLQESGERIVYKVNSSEGLYVFKLSSGSKTRQQLEKDTAIFSYLKEKDFSAPRLLKTKNDENFLPFNDQFLYAINFIEGSVPIANTDNYRQLGEITARLHRLNDYSIVTDFTAPSVIEEMIEKNKQYTIGSDYEALLRALPDFSKLPSSLIHTDIGLHNSIQKTDGEIVLVDWDDAGIGTRILDIGFPLICGFVKDNAFDIENARAYYRGYLKNADLTQQEKDHIFDAGLFYILMYSIFDGSGIDIKNWHKAQFAVQNRELIDSVISS